MSLFLGLFKLLVRAVIAAMRCGLCSWDVNAEVWVSVCGDCWCQSGCVIVCRCLHACVCVDVCVFFVGGLLDGSHLSVSLPKVDCTTDPPALEGPKMEAGPHPFIHSFIHPYIQQSSIANYKARIIPDNITATIITGSSVLEFAVWLFIFANLLSSVAVLAACIVT